MFVGRKGTGKTTLAKLFAKKSSKKFCIIDTDDHPDYAGIELCSLEDLKHWKIGDIRVITKDPLEALEILNRYCSNAFIICEDTGKYIEGKIQRQAKNFIIDHRKRNFDVAFMFHFLADVPPYICKQYDNLILFKTGDSLQDRQKKFANWHTIVKKLERIMKNKSFNYCENIAIDE